jgi:GDP-L-fucose synthase
MNSQPKIYIAGHRSMVDCEIMQNLQAQGHQNIITGTDVEIDLTDQAAVADFFQKERPDQFYLATAKV